MKFEPILGLEYTSSNDKFQISTAPSYKMKCQAICIAFVEKRKQSLLLVYLSIEQTICSNF